MTGSTVQSLVGLESVDSLDIRDHYHDGTCEDKDERDDAQSSNDVQSNKIYCEAMVSAQLFPVQIRKLTFPWGHHLDEKI
jgi:hypothetical protein